MNLSIHKLLTLVQQRRQEAVNSLTRNFKVDQAKQ